MNTTASEITVRVNDDSRTFNAPLTLLVMLQALAMAERRGIAVAINDHVVPRSQWPVRSVAEGDRVLIIQATQGG